MSRLSILTLTRFEFAIAQDRAVLTRNRRDFIRLHLTHLDHAGIIVCTEDPDFAALANRINEAISCEESLADQLITQL